MKIFRPDNTEGFTQDQLDVLNDEWEKLAATLGLDPDDDEYDLQAKFFADDVAKR